VMHLDIMYENQSTSVYGTKTQILFDSVYSILSNITCYKAAKYIIEMVKFLNITIFPSFL
jgi:hypothetical protein